MENPMVSLIGAHSRIVILLFFLVHWIHLGSSLLQEEIDSGKADGVDFLTILQDNGIYVLQSSKDIGDLFRLRAQSSSKVWQTHADDDDQQQESHSVDIMMVLIYSDHCPQSQQAVKMLEELLAVAAASPKSNLDWLPAPCFGKITLDQFLSMEIPRKEDSLETVPAVAIFVSDSFQTTYLWTLVEDAHHLLLQHKHRDSIDIVGLYWHYYSRLVLATQFVVGSLVEVTTSTPPADDNQPQEKEKLQEKRSIPQINMEPKRFSNLSQVQKFVCQYKTILYGDNAHPRDARSLFLTENETTLLREDLVVFVQCRRTPQHTNKLYDIFQHLFESMIHRSNLFYTTVVMEEMPQDEGEEENEEDQCPHEDGSVVVWRFPGRNNVDESCDLLSSHVWSPNVTHQDGESDDERNEAEKSNSLDFIQFHRAHASPSLLWFDRKIAAPIILSHSVQALLFINVHPSPILEQQKRKAARLVKDFGRFCQDKRRENQGFICALVPSTETRLLTTFGVDIWTPLDQQVLDYTLRHSETNTPEEKEDEPASLQSSWLPILLQIVLIDRRGGRMRLYRLDQPATTYGIAQFFRDFWANRLSPEFKSSFSNNDKDAESNPEIVFNEFGAQKLTTHDWVNIVSPQNGKKTKKHSMVLLISPICGHCKRLLSMFNQLSHLLLKQAPGWNEILNLGIVDVSTDDIISGLYDRDEGVADHSGIQIRWVPDMIYVAPTTPTVATEKNVMVQYNQIQNLTLLGNVSHYTDLLVWLLRVMDVGLPDNEGQFWNNLLVSLQNQLFETNV